MKYKLRPGIVRLRICDVDILAAKRELWPDFPAVRPVPRMWAVCWGLMEKGEDSDYVVSTFQKLFQNSEEKAGKMVEPILRAMYEQGYLLESEEP